MCLFIRDPGWQSRHCLGRAFLMVQVETQEGQQKQEVLTKPSAVSAHCHPVHIPLAGESHVDKSKVNGEGHVLSPQEPCSGRMD